MRTALVWQATSVGMCAHGWDSIAPLSFGKDGGTRVLMS